MSVHPSMLGPIGDQNVGQYLTAFADGELDAAQNLAVLRYIAANPQTLKSLEHEQRFRDTARRVIRAATPAAPAALRDRIEAIEALDAEPMQGLRFGLMRTISLAAAAVILLAFGVIAGRAIAPRPLVAIAPPAALVPVTVVDAVTKLHVDCSRFDAALHAGGYPKELAGVADVVKQDLSSANPYPDLTPAGYAFIGAGPCMRPLANTVHLLYRSTHGQVKDTLSVFVQPYTGQFALEPGKAYLLTPENAAHPMLVWRSKLAVYFVTGDDMAEVKAAAAVMPDRI